MFQSRFLLIFIISFLSSRSQTTYTWTGASDTDFSNPNNWNPTGGPTFVSDIAVFNSGSNNCVLTGGLSIGGWSITSGYSGTIDCDIYDVTINGNFSMNGGTFIMTSDNSTGMVIANGGSFFHTGGTFTDNGGMLVMSMPTTQIYTLTANNITLTQLRFQSTSNGTRSVTVSGVTTASLNWNSTLPLSLQGSIDITTNLSISSSASNAAPTGNTGTLNFTGAGPISFTGLAASSSSRGRLPNIVLNTTGNVTITNAINVQGDWTHTAGSIVASASSSVYFSGTGEVISGAAINGTSRNFNHIIVQSGASINLPTANDLVVSNTFSNVGTVSNASSAGLVFNGSAGAITGVTALAKVTIATSSTLSINSALSVSGLVDLQGTARLNTNSNLTLSSSATAKGSIGQISGGTVNGSVRVNSYIPGPTTGWAMIGAPVNGMSVLDLENSFFVTCTGCTYDPTVVPGGFYSVQGWDGDDFETTAISSVTSLTPGKGFWAYIGDGQTNTSDLTLVSNMAGIVTGAYSPTIKFGTGGGPWSTNFFGLAANPYPSPIDADAFLFNNQANINLNAYVYDAEANGGTGGFNTITFGSGTALPIGQGFYLEGLAGGNIVLQFDETIKVASNTNLSKGAPKVGKFSISMSGAGSTNDKIYFMFNSETTTGFDRYDLHKMKTSLSGLSNGGSPIHKSYISSEWFGEEFGVLSLPILTQSVSIPLYTKVTATGVYSLTLGDIVAFNSCVVLHDKYTNAYHDMNKGAYVATISDTTSAPRFELLICQDENATSVGVQELSPVKFVAIGSNQNGAYVLTQFQSDTKATVSAYNLMGQKIMDDFTIQGRVTQNYLPLTTEEKVIIVKVEANGVVTAKKIVLQN